MPLGKSDSDSALPRTCLERLPALDSHSCGLLPRPQVGNVGSQVRTSFLVDTTPPTLSDVSFPVATRQTQFAVSFKASDGNGWVG